MGSFFLPIVHFYSSWVLLSDINTAGIRGLAAVEWKQQIQLWEVKEFNFSATAKERSGNQVANAIAVNIINQIRASWFTKLQLI